MSVNRLSARALRMYGKRKAVTKKALYRHEEARAARLEADYRAVYTVFREVFPQAKRLNYPQSVMSEAGKLCEAACRHAQDKDFSAVLTQLALQLTDVAAKHTPRKHWAQR